MSGCTGPQAARAMPRPPAERSLPAPWRRPDLPVDTDGSPRMPGIPVAGNV